MGAKKETVVDGVWYESIADACRAVHLSTGSVTSLMQKYTITASEAIDMCRHRAKDHEGRYFRSMAAMCRYHGVNVSTFYSRMAEGLPLEMCLSRTKFYMGRGGRYPVLRFLKKSEE